MLGKISTSRFWLSAMTPKVAPFSLNQNSLTQTKTSCSRPSLKLSSSRPYLLWIYESIEERLEKHWWTRDLLSQNIEATSFNDFLTRESCSQGVTPESSRLPAYCHTKEERKKFKTLTWFVKWCTRKRRSNTLRQENTLGTRNGKQEQQQTANSDR